MKSKRIIKYLLVTLVILLFSGSKENDGFVSLFNGENLDGWYLKIRSGDAELAKEIFAVDNGVIHVFKDYPDSSGFMDNINNTHGLMYTNKKYSKFIFKFEYKWGKKIFNNFNQFQYDAGCYYNVYDDKIWPSGVEYQVRYDHTKNRNHTGDYWASNIQWYSADSITFSLPSEGGLEMPKKSGEHRALKGAQFNALNDGWNKCELIVMGDEYSIHKLNGQIVNMATDLGTSEGVIGLQCETAEIYYRNIMIKEFEESIPMEEFLK